MHNSHVSLFKRLSYTPLIIASLTLGLAPFTPQPHLSEKIRMLLAGQLVRPIDIFDLVMHALPFVLLTTKGLVDVKANLADKR